MLVEEGGAKLDRYNIVGRTALVWAINGAAGGKNSNLGGGGGRKVREGMLYCWMVQLRNMYGKEGAKHATLLMDWDHQQHKVKHSTVKTDLHHNN
jgi:hypothetical protein